VKTKEEKTGSMVTLQSSEGKEISEDEYEVELEANRLLRSDAGDVFSTDTVCGRCIKAASVHGISPN